MAIVGAAELDSALRGLRQRHSPAAAFMRHTFVGDNVILGLAAEILGRNLLQLCDAVRGHRMRRARHGVGGLAAAGGARPRQILRRVAPGDVALFPRHAEEFRDHAMHVGPGFRSEIADAGLDVDAAIGLDDKKPIEPYRAAGVAADRARRRRALSSRCACRCSPFFHPI